ncbi:hypothetical protein RF11_08082 [Thelohanellus kitauei]|uniref:Zinc finger PHD-type domain-containing protein n=1 Tax=Thelohanellus kitauei TaxID=669202 RepID=A0A0C2LZZ1_THEKT|nr:hypothetical protein RF11_08082 [Thelohanellus kitauei]
MNKDQARAFLRISVSQMALVCRFNRSKMSAITLLANLAYYYIRKCGLTLKLFCDEYNEVPSFSDAIHMLKLINFNIEDIMSFYSENDGFPFLYQNLPIIKNSQDFLDLPEIETMKVGEVEEDRESLNSSPVSDPQTHENGPRIRFVVKSDICESSDEEDQEELQTNEVDNPHSFILKFNFSPSDDVHPVHDVEMEPEYYADDEDDMMDEGMTVNECAICGQWQDDEEVIACSICQLFFHRNCIDFVETEDGWVCVDCIST